MLAVIEKSQQTNRPRMIAAGVRRSNSPTMPQASKNGPSWAVPSNGHLRYRSSPVKLFGYRGIWKNPYRNVHLGWFNSTASPVI